MIEIAEEVIIVSDSSKFKKSGHAIICEFDKIDKIITDDGIEESFKEILKNNNIELLIASWIIK